MLGVFKRRWKPKRASNTNRISGDAYTIEAEKPRIVPSVRQVHPVCDDKAQIIAYGNDNERPKCPTLDLDSCSTPYPKRASLDSNPSPNSYPLAPNICVEAGRIEFIKQSPDGATTSPEGTPPTPRTTPRVTVTRGQQTTEEDWSCAAEKGELESQLAQLEAALKLAQKKELRNKQFISKLQRQLSRREAAQRDADRERRLRADSEARTKQALQEANRFKSKLKILANEFSKMEETVRTLLIHKEQVEQLRQEKALLTATFENRCQHYQTTIRLLNQETSTLRQQLALRNCASMDEHPDVRTSSALSRFSEDTKKQYERCLDDVANQVVKALVAQKGLQEEIEALNKRIQELESENSALSSLLVQELKAESASGDLQKSATYTHWALADSPMTLAEENTSLDISPTNLMNSSLIIKHCNSFNSDVLESGRSDDNQINKTPSSELQPAEPDILETRLSADDKRRHKLLTKLWTELKGSEVTPKKLIEALSCVDPSLWIPAKRPASLSLPVIQTKYKSAKSILAQNNCKSEEETTGNESPESGNRDEGYSTMSSDVQAEVAKAPCETILQSCALEDLKEATDETDLESHLLVADVKDPDILYIPLNVLNLKARNSYPPGKEMVPFQHIMRSFSDSHLCIKITAAPSPCYTFSSPISSSPSIVLLDITENSISPLKRTRATTSLLATNLELNDHRLSWTSPDDILERTTWDKEYVQHWLRLDETRSALQQHHREILELEYDRTELEDWSLSLSSDDLRDQWKKLDAITPGQMSISTLPSIQENMLELEEDASECLWNNSSYMIDRENHEQCAFVMDAESEKPWPYAMNLQLNFNHSPDNSWSSGGSDCCHSHEPETCSKRSSAALSGCSDDTGELPAVGTDFTRDFYRLVKFESTKSLASTSSRSLGGALSENGDREATLQNVLTYIVEQQKYMNSRACLSGENTKEFNIEGPPQHIEEVKTCEIISELNGSNKSKSNRDENYVTLKQLCNEFSLNEQNAKVCDKIKQNITYAEEICLVTPLDIESENCSNITEHPVDICASINVEMTPMDYHDIITEENDTSPLNCGELMKSVDSNSESQTSSISIPDTIVSKIPRRKQTRTPTTPIRHTKSALYEPPKPTNSKIPHKSPKPGQKPRLGHQVSQPLHFVTSERLPQSPAGFVSNVIEGPPHRAVSFHERATSKDVIDELNRMIKNGEECLGGNESSDFHGSNLDEACQPTGWVHVEHDIDLTDPKARANLLDVMMASVSSDSSPTSSCGGSITSDSTEDHPDYGHLHRIHRFNRQKKVHAIRPQLAVVRAPVSSSRPSIIGRQDFFMRFGDKEKEAVASFDFLDELSTTSSSFCSLDGNLESCEQNDCRKGIESNMLKVTQV